MLRSVFVLLLLPLLYTVAFAHGVDYTIIEGASRTIEVTTAGGTPFSFERYEVFGPGDRAPYQVGRSDRAGLVSFVPDRPGDWTVKIWSEDGHGLTATVAVEDHQTRSPERGQGAGLNRFGGAVLGVVGILVLGLIIASITRRRRQ